MKRLLLIATVATGLFAQQAPPTPPTPDPDVVTAKAAVDSLGAKLAAKLAEAKALQDQLTAAQAKIAELTDQLATATAPDPVSIWIKTFPELYEFLMEMTAHPVTSFYSPGFINMADNPESENRRTLVCMSNTGIEVVGVK